MRVVTKAPLIIALGVAVLLPTVKYGFGLYGPQLIVNFTDSIPLGIYRLSPLLRPQLGSYVALTPPEKARKIAVGRPWFRENFQFIKQVAGIAGDRVCIEKECLTINGIELGPVLDKDRQGIPLPHFYGCYYIGKGHVFLLGPNSPWSFDSRYFGVIAVGEIEWQAEKVLY